jgi:hypothetical protein
MFHSIIEKEDGLDDDEEENGADEESDFAVQLKGKMGLKNKIQFVSKMLKMQRVLREEHENILKIKALNNNKLPQGILLEGKEALETFSEVKKLDSENEMRPQD